MKIATKLIASFAGVSAICGVVGGIGYWGLSRTAANIEEIGVVRLPSVDSLLMLEVEAQHIRGLMTLLGIPGLSTEARQQQYELLTESRERYETAWKTYEPLPQTVEEAEVWQRFVPAWNAWRAENNKLIELCRKFDENCIDDPAQLVGDLEQFSKDHYVVIQKVRNLLEHGTAFEGGEDHTACNAGKWLATFTTRNPRLVAAKHGLEEPHRRFHEATHQIKALVAQGQSEQARALYEQNVVTAIQAIDGQFKELFAVARDSRSLQQALLAQLLGPVSTTQAAAGELLHHLVQINRDVAADEVHAGQSTASSMKLVALAVVVVAVIVSMVLGLMISANIRKAIAAMVARLKDIAQGEGDLTQRVDEDRADELGELGKWFNTFVKKVHDIIVEVATATREVAGAATQIAASSEEMAQGMQEQTRQTTEVSSAIEELSQTVVEVAQKSANAANTATEAGNQAATGGQVVQQTVEGMKAIKQVVDDSSKAIGELGKRGEQIGEIIDVINDIADQTNLLALNAAIEAARAGEHGRGFAVVADEVRKLADRTTKATEEIAGSIQAIQTETAAAVKGMNAGTERVDEGVKLADQAGQALRAIVTGSQEVSTMIQAIAAGSEEQSAAAEQIARNIESINAVSQQAAEGAGQAAAAAAQLSSKSEQLQQIVGQFKLEAR